MARKIRQQLQVERVAVATRPIVIVDAEHWDSLPDAVKDAVVFLDVPHDVEADALARVRESLMARGAVAVKVRREHAPRAVVHAPQRVVAITTIDARRIAAEMLAEANAPDAVKEQARGIVERALAAGGVR